MTETRSFDGRPWERLQMPAEERVLAVRGGRVRLFATGQGSPVVLLHGLGESAIVWYGNIEALARHHTVYAPDLPGHGRSDRVESPTLDTGVSFVIGLLDALGAERAALVGGSVGGLLALATAVAASPRVSRLVLVDTAGLGRSIAPFLRLMSLPGVGEIMARPTRWGLHRLLRIIFYDPVRIPSGLVEALLRERRRPGNTRALLRMLRYGVTLLGVRQRGILRDRLAQVQAPTLLLWGRQDRLFPVAQAEEALRALPSARLHVFEECGHWPYMERRDEFNEVVRAFLAETDATTDE